MRPTQAHYLRKTAEKETAVNHRPLNGLHGYELMLAQLNQHQRQLKQIQSLERKIAFKKQSFEQYQPWIDGTLAKGAGVQDDVLMTMLIWAIDIGNYTTALAIAKYALFHGLTLPEQFNRTVGCAVVEEIADQAKKARDQKQLFAVDVLTQTAELTQDADMPDPVRARLLRELAELLQEEDPEQALIHCRRAIELDSNCGAKGLRTKLEKQLNQPITE